MLQTNTVLITGATSGIGLAFTKKYAQMGYCLLLASSNEEKLRREKEALLAWKPQLQVSIYPEDLSQVGAAKRLQDRIAEDGFQVDVLINNAGVCLSYFYVFES